MSDYSDLQTEDIMWDVWDALTEDLPAALAQVQARRIREPIILLPPATMNFGTRNTDTLKPDDYNHISLIGAPRSAAVEGDTSWAKTNHLLYLQWLVKGDTEHLTWLTACRYGEAILTVLNARSPFGGGRWELQTRAPQVNEVETIWLSYDPAKDVKRKICVGGGQITGVLEGVYHQ